MQLSSMNVRIRQSGTSFPVSGRGRVFSAHEKALNLQIDGASELATIVTDEPMMTVSSLLVSAESFTAIERGRGFEVHADRISFDSGLTLVLDASAATDFTGRIEPMRGWPRPTPSLLDDLLAAAGGDAHGGPGESGASPRSVGFAPLAVAMRGGPPYPAEPSDADPFARAAWKVVRPVLAGAVESEAALDHSFSLVGLGGGFTPSGDDFLVGMLAARTLLGEPLPAGPALAGLLGRCAATTLSGATILRQALRGCFPAYLCRFAHGFGGVAESYRRADPRIRELVERASHHGHSSGIDAVTGFGFGMLMENYRAATKRRRTGS